MMTPPMCSCGVGGAICVGFVPLLGMGDVCARCGHRERCHPGSVRDDGPAPAHPLNRKQRRALAVEARKARRRRR